MAQGGGKVRVKPPAFKRDSVDLGRHGRTWQTITAHELAVGDIVLNKGLVESIDSSDLDTVVGLIHVKLVMGDVLHYSPEDKVEAFHKSQILTTDNQ
jgi:hypothetical protein